MSKSEEGRDYAAYYKQMWEDALAKWRKDAERIAALEARLARAAQAINGLLECFEEAELPEPSHAGQCGPESGCDCICVERVFLAKSNAAIRAARAALASTPQETKR